MVQLRPERRAALCGMMKTVLHDTVNDALAETNGVTRAASAECAIGAMDAVRSAVNNALAAFAKDWNATQPDRLVALPPELVSEIFRQLDFADRLTASHVCSSWRRAALADRVLWAEYSFSDPEDDSSNASDDTPFQHRGAEGKASMLSLLLERSNPLPFTACMGYVPDAIAELLIAHMHRMEALWLGDFETASAAQRLLECDVPALKSFSYDVSPWADAPLAIDPRWADSQLESLHMSGRWVWPAGRVSTSLRILRRSMPEVLDDHWRLSDLFPNLTELCLTTIASQAHVDCLDPLPLALRSLSLVPIQDTLDYSALLRECRASGLHELHLSRPSTAASLHELLGLFQRTCSEHWTLLLNPNKMVLSPASHRADERYEYRIFGHMSSWLACAPGALGYLARVCELDIALSNLLDLWPSLLQGASLPALSRVVVQAPRELAPRICELETGARIEAPNVTSLAISLPLSPVRRVFEHDVPAFSIVAPIVRAFRAPALEDVEIEADDAETIRWNEVSRLDGLTRHVTARNRLVGSRTTWHFVPPGETQVYTQAPHASTAAG